MSADDDMKARAREYAKSKRIMRPDWIHDAFAEFARAEVERERQAIKDEIAALALTYAVSGNGRAERRAMECALLAIRARSTTK